MLPARRPRLASVSTGHLVGGDRLPGGRAGPGCRSGFGECVTDGSGGDARKFAWLLAGGLAGADPRPLPEPEARAIWYVPVRTRAWIGCVTDNVSRSSASVTDGCLPASAWTGLRRVWLGEQRSAFLAAEQITFDTILHAVDLVDARIEQLSCARSGTRPSRVRGGDLVAQLRAVLRGIDTLTVGLRSCEIGDFHRGFHTGGGVLAFQSLGFEHGPG